MSQPRVLIVHPEPSILALLGSMLQSLGHQIDEAANDRAAVRRLERGGIDLMIAGVDPFDSEAMELLSFSRRKHPQVPVVILFPAAHPERAREATRMGATTVLKFPMPANELRAAVTQACERPTTTPRINGSANHHLHGSQFAAQGGLTAPFQSSQPHLTSPPQTNGYAQPASQPQPHHQSQPTGPIQQPQAHRSSAESFRPFEGYTGTIPPSDEQPKFDLSGGFNVPHAVKATSFPGFSLLGDDSAIRQAVDLASTIAPVRAPVLIVGEQGTGKTLIARSIHQQSNRRDHPFLEVSCSGIDELGLERELFGQKYEGADGSERPGRLARAHQGTILLDEVAALSPNLQARLLQVIIDGEFEPLGASHRVQVDVRFVLSTRENLSSLVEQGKFRRDLYERINSVCLKLPPLRHRGNDILRLAEYFRDRFARDFSRPVVGFSPDAVELLVHHDWPGNVRELESVVQRGVALSQGSKITSANLAVGIVPGRSVRPTPYSPRPQIQANLALRPLKEALEEPEKQIIIQALRALNWNRQETARVLDINRTTLYKKMKKYGLLLEEPALLN